MGIWSESTVSEDRGTDSMNSEIQWVFVGLLYPLFSCLVIVISEVFCQHYSCVVSGLIFSASVGFLQRKKNSVHTLEFGITNLLSGRAPNSWSHQVSSSFWLIILPKKPVFHHAEAVKTQVVFSLLGLCWVVRDTSWKTRLLMHMFPGALYLAFNIHIVSP